MTEAEDNNDIILEDFHDPYLNLPLKTTFLLKWMAASCSNSKFVFKVDDDVFVNPERLWSSLESSYPGLKLEKLELALLVFLELGSSVNSVAEESWPLTPASALPSSRPLSPLAPHGHL